MASSFGGGATIGAGAAGGRREAENSGRSRVADKALNGTAHNGLPARALDIRRAAGGVATPVPSVAGADATLILARAGRADPLDRQPLAPPRRRSTPGGSPRAASV